MVRYTAQANTSVNHRSPCSSKVRDVILLYAKAGVLVSNVMTVAAFRLVAPVAAATLAAVNLTILFVIGDASL